MTGEEKRKQLKEQYKKDLKLRKEYIEKAKKLQKLKNVNKALNDMQRQTEDDSDDLIAQLNQETALTEAKLEIALDEAQEQQKQLELLAKEAELAKLNALNLVEEMKKSMGIEPSKTDSSSTEKKATTSTSEEKQNPEEEKEEKDDDSSKKTMGDW